MAKKRKINTTTKTQQIQPQNTDKDIPLRKIIIGIGCLLILTGVVWIIFSNTQADEQEWTVDEQGILSYPVDRTEPVFESRIDEHNSEFTLEYLNYSSRDATISAAVRIPNSSVPVPGVLILPGATVTKEGEQGLALELIEMGYASMVIDQRNLGVVDVQHDEELFDAGEEPVEHKMVFDALMAVDVMRQYPKINPQNIAIIGISNGGRFAITAAGIDPSIKGVIGISTSGYNTESIISNSPNPLSETRIRFLRSIDPESYLDKLAPRKLVMIHMEHDSIISVYMAKTTYDKAEEPKAFYPIEGTGHGYNSAMRPHLEDELEQIFNTI
jgi:hypothetical protein